MSKDRIQTRGACPLGLPDETLSALRDELLPTDEAAQVRAHAAGCAACREQLAGFERVGAALRGQRLAGPSPRLWADVRAAIAEGKRSHAARSRARPMWSGLGALAAALVIALLFALALRGALVGRGGPSTHLQPTATPFATSAPQPPIKGTPPNWHFYSLPEGLVGFNGSSLTIAPGDGETAYACAGVSGAGTIDAGSQYAQVAVTHDRGAHWMPGSAIALGSACNQMVVDQSNASIVVAGSGQYLFLSMDSGVSWRPFPSLGRVDSIGSLAWPGSGAAYALTGTYDAALRGDLIHLATSTDELRSWRSIDGGVLDGEVHQFWVNAASGDLLVATATSFWESADGGAHWTRIALPSGSPVIYVTWAEGASTWRICSAKVCTVNGGATWTPLPAIALPSGFSHIEPIALLADGALLVRATSTTPNALEFYLLPRGSTRWVDIGLAPAPFGSLVYAPSQEGGVLWELLTDGQNLYSQYYSAPLPAGG